MRHCITFFLRSLSLQLIDLLFSLLVYCPKHYRHIIHITMSRTNLLNPFKIVSPLGRFSGIQFRSFSCYKAQRSDGRSTTVDSAAPTNPRWFAELQTRIKRLGSAQYPLECVQKAEQLLHHTEMNWLEFLAGREGFLIDREWRALDSHQVLWGDMVSRSTTSAAIWDG